MTSQVHWIWCTYLHFLGYPPSNYQQLAWPPGRRPSRDAKQSLKSDAPTRAVGMSQKQTPKKSERNPGGGDFFAIGKIDSEIPPILKCFVFLSIRNCFCNSHGIHGTGMVYLPTNLPVLLRFGTKPGYPKPNLRDRLQREAHGPNTGSFWTQSWTNGR